MKKANAFLAKQKPLLIKEISKKPIKLTVDHAFLPADIKLTRRGLEFAEGHYDKANLIEKGGLVTFANKVELGAGTFAADVSIYGKAFRKTFFNPKKTMKEILKESYDALAKLDKSSIKKLGNGTTEALGSTKEGIIIHYKINPFKGKVTSNYVHEESMLKKFRKR